MMRRALPGIAFCLSCCVLCGLPVRAEQVRLAVASNFRHAAKNLAESFERAGQHRVTLIYGSTGKHYAQILNGAPFDAFLAADARRPELLEKEGMVVDGIRFTYARGRVVLWSSKSGLVDPAGSVLTEGGFRHLAIANPSLAPYGLAARQILVELGLWDRLEANMVRGENVGQTFQFVRTGNAELGFVALAQVVGLGEQVEGSYWEVPDHLYESIEQQAVLLNDNLAARAFLEFLRSDAARREILGSGYGLPEGTSP